jgi:glycosyltransferase involved in cell wall biosynthesis
LHDRALLLGARPDSSRVIPYGVDTSAFMPRPEAGALVREELGLAPDTPIVLVLGRFVYKKGFNVLLDAWPEIGKQHPNARLVMVGDGDLREDLEAQARQLGIADKVIFTGMLDRTRTALYLNAPDVYVVPSIRDQSGNVDGLPNVLLEGMGVGRPIVASRVAGIPQVIDDGVHGLLVPEKDPVALAQAINKLLADRALAQRLGLAARQRIEQELTWDTAAERFEEVYQRALAAS